MNNRAKYATMRKLMNKLFWFASILAAAVMAFAVLVGLRIYRFPLVPQYKHADFAIFINGQRLDYSTDRYTDPDYCEEGIFVVSDEETKPGDYLREGGQVIHVHKGTATYADFFDSIGIEFDGEIFKDDRGNEYTQTETHAFRVFLNKQEVKAVHEREIKDLDHLLISYGKRDREESELAYELAQLPDLACFYSVVCPYEAPSVKDLCVPDNYYRTILYYWFGI